MKQIPYILKKGGSTLDLHKVVEAGLLGVALGLAVVAASVVITAIVPLVTAWCVGSPSVDGSSTTEGSAAAPTRREPH
jgi:hypothetical protein